MMLPYLEQQPLFNACNFMLNPLQFNPACRPTTGSRISPS